MKNKTEFNYGDLLLSKYKDKTFKINDIEYKLRIENYSIDDITHITRIGYKIVSINVVEINIRDLTELTCCIKEWLFENFFIINYKENINAHYNIIYFDIEGVIK